MSWIINAIDEKKGKINLQDNAFLSHHHSIEVVLAFLSNGSGVSRKPVKNEGENKYITRIFLKKKNSTLAIATTILDKENIKTEIIISSDVLNTLVGTLGYFKYASQQTPGAIGTNNQYLQSGAKPYGISFINKYRKK
jgi:hypothetical protein